MGIDNYSDGPAPSAPPLQDMGGVVGYGQQPVQLNPVERAHQFGQQAVAADQKGDWDGALRSYEQAVEALRVVMQQQRTPQGVDKVQTFITSYNDRIDGIRRNKRRLKASQQEQQPAPPSVPSSSRPAPTSAPTPSSGWDGTDFSGKRRGTFDKALSLIDQAKSYDMRGDLLKAKAAYAEAIELLICLIKTEKDVSTLQLLNAKTNEFMTRAEALNKRIEELGIKPPR